MPYLQDHYPAEYTHCHGCGTSNPHGLHIKSEWVNGEGLCRFTPAPHHLAMPGYVYGGLLACLVDCHAMATAAAASMVAAGEVPCHDPTRRFVTASLQLDYAKPTPIGVELFLRAVPKVTGDRKVTVHVSVLANGVECVRANVLAVRLPSTMTLPKDA